MPALCPPSRTPSCISSHLSSPIPAFCARAVSMIKRGSKFSEHFPSTSDDILWLRHFQPANPSGSEEALGNRRSAAIGFMPGLWRAINNKSAFAELVAAASEPKSRAVHSGISGYHSCSISPASFHPETCAFPRPTCQRVRFACACNLCLTIVQVLATGSNGRRVGCNTGRRRCWSVRTCY